MIVNESNGEIDMELGDTAWVDLGNGVRVQDTDAVRAMFAEEEPDKPAEKVAEMYDEEVYPMVVGGALTFADAAAQQEAREMQNEAYHLFDNFRMISSNIWYSDEVTNKGQAIQDLAGELAVALQGLDVMEESVDADDNPDTEQPNAEGQEPDATGGDPESESVSTAPEDGAIVEETEPMPDNESEVTTTQEPQEVQESDKTDQLCESVGGAQVLELGALAEADPGRGPLTMKVQLIQPGPGNKADRHYYPAEMLRRDAQKFVGAKMYETDHEDKAKTTKSWVSTVREIIGFTDSGAPLGEVVVHSPDFADRVSNLDAEKLLHMMECSIHAKGNVAEKEVDGETYRVVESIDSVSSVDWVTRGGAGGKAVDIMETDKPADAPEVQETEEPVPDKEERQVMEKETVRAWLDEKARLPDAVIELLAEREYETEGALEQAVKDMGASLAQHSDSGKPRDSGDSKPAPELSETEKQDRTDAGIDASNARFLGR